KDSAPDLFFSEQREPTFDHIDPGGAGRREVKMEARTFHEPSMDHSLVSAIVVQDEMHVQGIGHGLLNRVQKLAKFFASMSTMDLADNTSGFDFQSGKQRC